MSPNEETNDILKLIWQEIKALGTGLGGRIDQTNTRLDEMRVELSGRIQRLEERTDSLEHALVASEMRVATEVVALAGVVREMRDAFLENRLDQRRLTEIELRVGALERRSA